MLVPALQGPAGGSGSHGSERLSGLRSLLAACGQRREPRKLA